MYELQSEDHVHDTAWPEKDALKDRIREDEARKPVVLLFPPLSFDLP